MDQASKRPGLSRLRSLDCDRGSKRIFSVDDDPTEIEVDQMHQLEDVSQGGRGLPPLIRNFSGLPADISVTHSRISEECPGRVADLEQSYPEIDQQDARSQTSLESFTLRERQEAINKTHPFGIRIWKPALYKKKRSVEQAADEDIHETKLRKITWQTHITNWVWTLTLGGWLFAITAILAAVTALVGAFTEDALSYANFQWQMAKYLLWPFAKVVYLVQDEQYLNEDLNEGISAQQFYNWIASYSNKLFNHQENSVNDHTRIPYSSHDNTLTDGRPKHPSYGSIQNFMKNQQRDFVGHVSGPDYMGSTHNLTTGNHIYRENAISSEHLEDSNGNPPQHNTRGTNRKSIQRRYFGRGKWSWGRMVFYFLFHVVIQPIVYVFALILWLIVFTIPMSKILSDLMYHCRKHPLALGFKSISLKGVNSNGIIESNRDKNILLCTFRSAGWHYYKFTIDGTNVIVVNLLSIVFFTIFDFYVLKEEFHFNIWLANDSTIFLLCLISIIPLAFYIGQAVASISAQTSMGMGAVINAFFSTIVEVFLYCVALSQNKGLLVEGSMIGSILGAVLLLPGLSMCGGALNRKTQRYNPASAGVSSVMLIFSMFVMFIPTILYELYGGYTIDCDSKGNHTRGIITIRNIMSRNCTIRRLPPTFDKLYTKIISPMSIMCALLLFLAYAIGLWFTLRTHAKLIWKLPINEMIKEPGVPVSTVTSHTADMQHDNETSNSKAANTGHSGPNWSRNKSTFILLVATVLYAIIAEILVTCVDSVLEDIPLMTPKFLGLTIFALVPNTTEFLNAISFAIQGNIALSMEIGSAYALQVCLLQIPALVIFSVYHTWDLDKALISIRDQMFSLVFPTWDLVATMISIFMFTYLYAEGKSNYFKGSMLILLYVVLILGFFLQDEISTWTES